MWSRRVLWLMRGFLILRRMAFEFLNKARPRLRVVWEASGYGRLTTSGKRSRMHPVLLQKVYEGAHLRQK
jgi:hypothetical protein